MRTRKWMAILGSLALIGMLAGCALLNSPPTANFTWSPQDPLARTDVQFTDLSMDDKGIISWVWDFGDNDSSPSQNPKHEYEIGGTYTVRLTVTDDGGSTATISKTITVTPSLDGRWTGIFTDLAFNSDAMSFDLRHSATGGITGTLYINTQAFPLVSASFNASTREVQISVSNVIFRGTLDASERRIAGYWYDSLAGWRGEDWFVTLQ